MARTITLLLLMGSALAVASPEPPSLHKPLYKHQFNLHPSHPRHTENRAMPGIEFPDVTKTPSPGGPIPIPYPNIGMSSDTDNGSKKVKVNGKMPGVKNTMPETRSPEKPVQPERNIVPPRLDGKAYFAPWSMDVKFEGKNTTRLDDPRFHHRKNILP